MDDVCPGRFNLDAIWWPNSADIIIRHQIHPMRIHGDSLWFSVGKAGFIHQRHYDAEFVKQMQKQLSLKARQFREREKHLMASEIWTCGIWFSRREGNVQDGKESWAQAKGSSKRLKKGGLWQCALSRWRRLLEGMQSSGVFNEDSSFYGGMVWRHFMKTEIWKSHKNYKGVKSSWML